MQHNLTWSLLLPTSLILFQTVVFLVLAVLLLRRIKLIASPLAELDTCAALVSGTILLGMLLISTSSTGGLYQSFVFEHGAQVYTVRNTFNRFASFFFIVACAQFMFLSFSWFLSNVFIDKNSLLSEARAGNLPMGILLVFILLGVAIGCFAVAKSVCDLLIPVSLNFN